VHNPCTPHWKAVKRIFRYLKGTLNYALHFHKSDDFKIITYSDSDWAGDFDTLHSTSGFRFYLGRSSIS
jgi:hypothetical protein